MNAASKQFFWLLLVVSCAAGQDAPVSLQGVKVIQTETGIQVDVSLDGRVQPSVLMTSNPDRLVLDFPNTTSAPKQQRINVNLKGVRAVRYGLNSAEPAITRVVVDLESQQPYEVRNNGNTISLTITGAQAAANARRAPAPAASGGLIGIFRRRSNPSAPAPDSEEAQNRSTPEPTPETTPAPVASTKTSTDTEIPASGTSAPTAAHPNRGSLQEGTVFPGMGSPGAGSVPSVTADAAAKSATPVAVVAPGAASQNSSVSVTVDNKSPAVAVVSTLATNPPAQVTVSIAPAANESPKTTSPPVVSTVPSPKPAPPAPIAASNLPSRSQSNMPAIAASVVPPPAAVPIAQADAKPAVAMPQVEPVAPPAVAEAKSESASPLVAASDANAHTAAVTAETPAESSGTGETAGNEANAATSDSADTTGPALAAIDPNLKTVFRVKYVADGVAYLDGGRSSGLAEGMKLEIKETDLPIKQGTTADPTDPRVVAELEVSGLAETSAVTDIKSPKRPVKVGDIAYLSNGDAQALIQQRTLSPTRQYPVVIAFSEGDPLDEEVRKEVPRPPLPSVNRARGRIGFDYMGTISHDTPSSKNTDVGMVLRTDITRIGGTYWNLSGYWRGRLHSQSASQQQTLQDLINRTYHLGMFYDSPSSPWVVGVGRLYLPWAPSLDTIDGGYFGAKVGGGATIGMFAGSTPDPTSWSYNPDRRIAGTFINFSGGSYDAFHYTSTSGLGLSALKWQIDRPFIFFENTLSYKRYLSIYDSTQADDPRGNAAVASPGPGLSRNFLTVRLQVHPRVELDFNHNYLRDIPTYDPTLVGTGLLDKYLFQGFSAGARVEVLKQVYVYTNLGSSNRTGDTKHALNQLYGLTFSRLPWWGLRADAHYSRFSSAFADGSYRSISLGRNLTDDFRFDVLVGDQNYTSTLAASDRTRFVNTNFEFSFGPRYFMQGGFTVNRGQTQNYDQWLLTLGYRFDSKARH